MGEIGAGGAGEGDDVGHRVGVVADHVVGGIHAVAEVAAVDVPGRDGSIVVQVAQNTFHAAHERENVAGGLAIHGFGNAAAQGVIAVGDVLAGEAAVPGDAGGAVVFVVAQPNQAPGSHSRRIGPRQPARGWS